MEASDRKRGAFPDGGDRRDTRCPQRRKEAGEQRNAGPEDDRHDNRLRREHRSRLREALEQHLEALEEAEPEHEPEQRRQRADHCTLQEDGPQNLPARCPQRAKRCELARALRHRHRDRVEDDEGADEQGDAAECEQDVLEAA